MFIKRIWFISLFIFSISTVFGQRLANKTENIVGKKWGLAHYIEVYLNESDTLFSLHDCQQEFLQLNADKSYQFSAFDRQENGNWKQENDSTFILTDKNGKLVRRYELYGTSEDSMAILDITQRNSYLEIYSVCRENDTQFYDSRDIYKETVGYGFVAGIQYYKSPVLELGIAKARWNWRKTFFAVSLSAELAPFNESFKKDFEIRQTTLGTDTVQISPWKNYYGLALTGWTQSWVALGAGATIHTDGEKTHPGARLLLGLSPRTFLGKLGNGTHLTYSYQFLFAKQGVNNLIENINRHSFNLRFVIPFKTKEVEVRKIRDYEN